MSEVRDHYLNGKYANQRLQIKTSFAHPPSSFLLGNTFLTDKNGIDFACLYWWHNFSENDKRRRDSFEHFAERNLYSHHSSKLHNASLWPCRHKSSKLRSLHHPLHKKRKHNKLRTLVIHFYNMCVIWWTGCKRSTIVYYRSCWRCPPALHHLLVCPSLTAAEMVCFAGKKVCSETELSTFYL